MSIAAFLESPRFVPPAQWDVDYQEDYGTIIIRRASGRERRYLPTQFSTGKLTFSIGDDRLADIYWLKRFERAVYGKTTGFRVQNPADYLSCDQFDPILATTGVPTALDCPLVPLAGTLGAPGSTYQMSKAYSIGSLGTSDLTSYIKPIVKPVSQALVASAFPVIVANDSGAADTHFTVDYTTGILTQTSGFTGIPTSWGGQFDTPMRFDAAVVTHIENGLLAPLSFDLVEYFL